MEHDKSYYVAALQIAELGLNRIQSNNRTISKDEGIAIAGNYWSAIIDLLIEQKVAQSQFGDVYISHEERLSPILEDCKHHITRIEKEEHDRDLNNKGIESSIKRSKQANIIAIVALLLSLAAIAIELIKLQQGQP